MAMPMESVIEERLSAVEAAVAELQRRTPMRDSLRGLIGSQAGEPAFEEVLALGREFRMADRADGESLP
jgi:hypothetical protein